MRDHYTLNFPYMCQKQEASPAEAAVINGSCTCITCITCVHNMYNLCTCVYMYTYSGVLRTGSSQNQLSLVTFYTQ